MINIYLFSTIKSPRKQAGVGIYILEAILKNGPATKTVVKRLEEVTETQAAIQLVKEAFGRIRDIQPVTLYTEEGYLVGLFKDKRLEKWKKNGWKTTKGKEVAHREELEAIYNMHIPVEEVDQGIHSYYEWMKSQAKKEEMKCMIDSGNSTAQRK